MEGLISLLLAAIFWIATHNGFAGTDIRTRLVGKIGEVGFRIAYAVTSIIAIMMLVQAWACGATGTTRIILRSQFVPLM